MRSEKDIRTMLEKIEADERLSYPYATIDVNAPLALIQLSGECKISALKWILEEQSHLSI